MELSRGCASDHAGSAQVRADDGAAETELAISSPRRDDVQVAGASSLRTPTTSAISAFLSRSAS
jgi:hypothetical protein